MNQPRLNEFGFQYDASIGQLSMAYGLPEDEMTQRVYSLAEQVHRHYCLGKGLVTHNEARPDQHVAISILMSLAGADWWLVKGLPAAPLFGADIVDEETVVLHPGERHATIEDISRDASPGPATLGGSPQTGPSVTVAPDGSFVNYGDDTVLGWADDPTEGR